MQKKHYCYIDKIFWPLRCDNFTKKYLSLIAPEQFFTYNYLWKRSIFSVCQKSIFSPFFLEHLRLLWRPKKDILNEISWVPRKFHRQNLIIKNIFCVIHFRPPNDLISIITVISDNPVQYQYWLVEYGYFSEV